jgi:hypothetical protein
MPGKPGLAHFDPISTLKLLIGARTLLLVLSAGFMLVFANKAAPEMQFFLKSVLALGFIHVSSLLSPWRWVSWGVFTVALGAFIYFVASSMGAFDGIEIIAAYVTLAALDQFFVTVLFKPANRATDIGL